MRSRSSRTSSSVGRDTEDHPRRVADLPIGEEHRRHDEEQHDRGAKEPPHEVATEPVTDQRRSLAPAALPGPPEPNAPGVADAARRPRRLGSPPPPASWPRGDGTRAPRSSVHPHVHRDDPVIRAEFPCEALGNPIGALQQPRPARPRSGSCPSLTSARRGLVPLLAGHRSRLGDPGIEVRIAEHRHDAPHTRSAPRMSRHSPSAGSPARAARHRGPRSGVGFDTARGLNTPGSSTATVFGIPTEVSIAPIASTISPFRGVEPSRVET